MTLKANKFPMKFTLHLFNNDLQKHKIVLKEMNNSRDTY